MTNESLIKEVIRLTRRGEIKWKREFCRVIKKGEILEELGYEARTRDLHFVVIPRMIFKSELFIEDLRILTKRRTINELLDAIYEEENR